MMSRLRRGDRTALWWCAAACTCPPPRHSSIIVLLFMVDAAIHLTKSVITYRQFCVNVLFGGEREGGWPFASALLIQPQADEKFQVAVPEGEHARPGRAGVGAGCFDSTLAC